MTAPALLLIDIQQGLDHPQYGARNNPGAEGNIAALLGAWRKAGRPVVHVQHMSVDPDSQLRPGLPGNAFKVEALPVAGEPVFRKSVNSAFTGTGLAEHLKGRGIVALVVVGLTTDHCISSTVRAAAELGFHVTVVDDATAAHERPDADGVLVPAAIMHRAAIASLKDEFATITRTTALLAEL